MAGVCAGPTQDTRPSFSDPVDCRGGALRPWDQRDVSPRLQCYIQKGFGPAALGSARCAAPCPSPLIVGVACTGTVLLSVRW